MHINFFVALLSVFSVYMFISFRYLMACSSTAGKCAFTYGALLLATISFMLYIYIVGYGEAGNIAIYYVLTFIGLVLVGKIVFGETISTMQYVGAAFIILGLGIWIFFEDKNNKDTVVYPLLG